MGPVDNLPAMDPKSCYILELSVVPGGARRGERFVYRSLEHIHRCLAWEFLGDPVSRFAAAMLAIGYGETIRLWIVQRGVVTAAIDLDDFLRVTVGRKGPLTLARAK